jgi:hypothetical protein
MTDQKRPTSAPTTMLGRKLAGQSTPARPDSPLAQVLKLGPRGELVELPVLGPAWVQIITASDVTDIEAQVTRRMKERELEASAMTVLSWEAERAMLTLARSVRSADDRAAPFGTVDEWAQLDSDTLAACWTVYGDVRERLSVLADDLSPEVRAAIAVAHASGNKAALRSFGVNRIAQYLTSMDISSDAPSGGE